MAVPSSSCSSSRPKLSVVSRKVAVPSSSAVMLPRSPAWSPCSASVGVVPPAEANARSPAGSQIPVSWTWMPCASRLTPLPRPRRSRHRSPRSSSPPPAAPRRRSGPRCLEGGGQGGPHLRHRAGGGGGLLRRDRGQRAVTTKTHAVAIPNTGRMSLSLSEGGQAARVAAASRAGRVAWQVRPAPSSRPGTPAQARRAIPSRRASPPVGAGLWRRSRPVKARLPRIRQPWGRRSGGDADPVVGVARRVLSTTAVVMDQTPPRLVARALVSARIAAGPARGSNRSGGSAATVFLDSGRGAHRACRSGHKGAWPGRAMRRAPRRSAGRARVLGQHSFDDHNQRPAQAPYLVGPHQPRNGTACGRHLHHRSRRVFCSNTTDVTRPTSEPFPVTTGHPNSAATSTSSPHRRARTTSLSRAGGPSSVTASEAEAAHVAGVHDNHARARSPRRRRTARATSSWRCASM